MNKLYNDINKNCNNRYRTYIPNMNVMKPRISQSSSIPWDKALYTTIRYTPMHPCIVTHVKSVNHL